MTGFESKRQMSQDKLNDDDAQGYIAEMHHANDYDRSDASILTEWIAFVVALLLNAVLAFAVWRFV
jgi:hypothetical protein